MQAAELAAELILILLVGFGARKGKLVGGEFNKQVSAFVMKIALPCMIVDSMNVEISAQELKNCAWILVVSSAVLLVGLAVGLILGRLLGKKLPERILRFGMMFPNFNFFGLVVVENLGGEQLLFYYLIYIIPVRVTIYVLAKVMLTPPAARQGRMSWGERLRLVISPPLVAVFIGLGLSALKVQLPTVLQYGLDTLGGMAAPLGILLCGSTLGGFPVKKMITGSSVALSLLRNFFMPFLIYGLCLLLRLPELYTRLAVVYSALPVASLLGTYVLQYDPSPRSQQDGAGFVFVSTLLSAVSLTLFVSLLQ